MSSKLLERARRMMIRRREPLRFCLGKPEELAVLFAGPPDLRYRAYLVIPELLLQTSR
jgi:hypothetical protein